ncbi:pyridine nucleotide-disulfide oxidoreductase [Planosporangium mesophilum]|uniref:Pyridine nucleotide-disulfide oxidoreductase n=2 Tax=Planosporangium mesophilum TaxID=689768 RepID=A0A8J3T6R9_9ACTN|nr:NAD(P)/FAD-dependent oxidoreductase [Planosporangium mesophilum]NJC83208.1 NAD(P)/FAD-dependent oxidoreductase [Planosporangium mesophilum]GII21580.1 pyridine nucleotide-disulfide oxidoreductase [Planosporangium mesophilum]
MSEQVDVVVIGLGVGGEEVAGKLAEAGLSVVGIEDRLVGGECPYWGCIPSKMMIRAANLLAEARRVDGLAGSARVSPDWAPVARRIRDEATDNWNDRAAVDRFTGKGGRFVRGRGRLVGPGRVAVEDTEFVAGRGVVVATGTEPAIPPIEGLAGTPYWTNRDAIEAETLPGSLLVLGGGAIGLELAQVYARFGVDVTIVEASDRILAMEEPESSALLAEALGRDKVSILTGARAASVGHDGAAFTLTLSDGRQVTGQKLLVATGRRTNLTGLGVETAGLDPHARAIEVDDRMRAGEKLWAVGDVTGHGAFTHVAMYQAGVAISDILGRGGPPVDYRALSRVTFTDPEVGAVGLTEQQARDRGVDVRVGTAQIPESSRGWIHKAGNDGFIKLVADADRGVLVGATSAGPTGGEVLSGLAVAVHGEVPVERLRHMIYAYPTFHRAIEAALADLG